jgi:hypothetical protein
MSSLWEGEGEGGGVWGGDCQEEVGVGAWALAAEGSRGPAGRHSSRQPPSMGRTHQTHHSRHSMAAAWGEGGRAEGGAEPSMLAAPDCCGLRRTAPACGGRCAGQQVGHTKPQQPGPAARAPPPNPPHAPGWQRRCRWAAPAAPRASTPPTSRARAPRAPAARRARRASRRGRRGISPAARSAPRARPTASRAWGVGWRGGGARVSGGRRANRIWPAARSAPRVVRARGLLQRLLLRRQRPAAASALMVRTPEPRPAHPPPPPTGTPVSSRPAPPVPPPHHTPLPAPCPHTAPPPSPQATHCDTSVQ